MDPDQELADWVQIQITVMLQRKCVERAEEVAVQLDKMRRLYELRQAEGRAWLAEANRLGDLALEQAAEIARAMDADEATWAAIETAHMLTADDKVCDG